MCEQLFAFVYFLLVCLVHLGQKNAPGMFDRPFFEYARAHLLSGAAITITISPAEWAAFKIWFFMHCCIFGLGRCFGTCPARLDLIPLRFLARASIGNLGLYVDTRPEMETGLGWAVAGWGVSRTVSNPSLRAEEFHFER